MIHAVLIAFDNPRQTRTRWERDVLPALMHTKLPHCLTVIDNSAVEHPELRDLFGVDYLHQNGANLMYGPSINLAVPRYSSQYILYACTRHGYALDPSWVSDLIRPMREDPEIGQTGYLMGSNSPGGVAHDTKCPWVKDKYYFEDGVRQHVQGGVFAARTQLMLRFPYPPEINHLYTDHILTWEILKAGFKCVNVSSIVSVWKDVWPKHKMDGIKYLHDESRECTQ